MTIDECIDAACNYWEDLEGDQQETLLAQLCDIAGTTDDLRRIRSDTQYERERGRAIRTRALREIDGLIEICEGIWGEDGP